MPTSYVTFSILPGIKLNYPDYDFVKNLPVIRASAVHIQVENNFEI